MLDFKAEKIFKVVVGRMNAMKGEDYTVSEENGKTKLTWTGSFAQGGDEAIVSGDDVFCTYSTFDAESSSGGGSSIAGGFIDWDIDNKTGSGQVTLGVDGGILKSGGDYGYNVNVLSQEVIEGDGYFEFTKSSTFLDTVIGFAKTASSNGGYSDMEIATYVAGVGTYETLHSGNTWISAVNGDIVRFERIGTQAFIKVNGTVIAQKTVGLEPLKASITFASVGKGISTSSISE